MVKDNEQIWLISFERRFAKESHPVNEKIHPDGLVAVFATSEEQAKELSCKHFGCDWADVTRFYSGFREDFPKGLIGQIGRGSGLLTFYESSAKFPGDDI